MNDLRFALRQLRKSPGFTIVALITLALGIGANTAIFSVINAVLLRPLPYPEPHRIIAVNESAPGQASIALSYPDYADLRQDNTVFEHFAVSRFDGDSFTPQLGGVGEHVGVAYVTANFFKVIGLNPQIGRTFTDEEDRVGGPALAVISDRLWRRVFHADPAVLGRDISLHDRPFTVLGVMPAALTSPQDSDIWVPIMRRTANPGWQSRAIHPLMYGWGRLKAGVSLAQAQRELSTIGARLAKDHAETNKGIDVAARPLLDSIVGDYRKNLTLLLGAVALVALVACANLANLFAARGAARAREFAIRAAVGASRGRIVRQLFMESAIIALAGGALGFLFALWSRDTLVALGPPGVERFREIAFDGNVLGFTFLVAAGTTVLFGLLPAWKASRADMQIALHTTTGRASESRAAARTRDWLVVGEIALTLVLLSSAALVLKSFANAQNLSLGYEPQNLLTARIDLPFTKYKETTQVVNFENALLDKIRALPGVDNVALGSNPPLLSGWQIGFLREGVVATPADQPSAESEVVAGDYFATFKATLLRGRTLNANDAKDAPPVTVIDQELADQYFRGEDPIGKRLSMHPDDEGTDNRFFEIVGVVARMKFHDFADATPMPVAFFSQAQIDRRNLVLLVRGSQVDRLERTIREIVASIDPTQPVYDVRPMIDRVRETC